MRYLLILVAFALTSPQLASAFTACPASQFEIAFEPNSTTLTSAGRETLGAGYNRARWCDNPVYTIMTNEGDPIGRERAQFVRTELIALGLSAAIPVSIAIDEPWTEARADRIIVLLEYDN